MIKKNKKDGKKDVWCNIIFGWVLSEIRKKTFLC